MSLPTPRAVFAQGFESIGRKTYLNNSIKRAISKYNDSYEPPKISMDSTQSIEDFILQINDLGYASKTIDRSNVFIMDKYEKYKLAADLLIELNSMKDILLIDDNGAIVKYDGHLTDWFIEVMNILKDLYEDIYLLIASRFSVFKAPENIKNYILRVDIPELSPSERVGLFNAYVEIYSMEDKVNREDIVNIKKLLSGYPEQVKYLANRVKESSMSEVMSDSKDIVEYNNEQVYSIIRKYETERKDFNLLLLLSNIDLISFNILESLIEGENEQYYNALLQKFFIEGLCVRFGADNEYFRVNDIVRDYIKRLKYKIPAYFQNKLTHNLKTYIANNSFEESNITEYFYYIQQALLQGEDIPEKYLLPSHFLRTIAQLYNTQKYSDVIKIAKKVLTNEEYMDDTMVYEIRHYYCSSLARKRDNSFFDEVKKITDKSEQFFLKGLYFRLEGKYKKALEMLDIAMEKKPNFSRAKREKVQVYLSVCEYEIAAPLAKENYNKWKENLYHIHAYFIMLLQEEINEKNEKILLTLLKKLELMQHMSDKAKEMFLECKALFTSFYLNDKDEAIKLIDELIQTYPKTIYPLLAKFDILEKHSDIDNMREVLKIIKSKDKKNTNHIIHTSVVVRTIAFLISIGENKEAKREYNSLVRDTEYSFTSIKSKYNIQ
jgi:hypothetical protein